jgi:hypothetical protein
MKIRVEISDEDLGRSLLQKVLDILSDIPGAHQVFPYPFDLRTSGNLVCLVKNNNSAYWLVESEKITALVDAANILIHGEIRTWG